MPPGGWIEGATLGRVADSLGPAVLQVLSAPAGMDVVMSEPVLFDRTGPLQVEAGDVVLAIGVPPENEEAERLLRDAAARGAAAVVVKLHARRPPAAVLAASEETGIALLGVPSETSWDHVYSVVRSAIASAGVPSEGVVAEGIPVGDLFTLANAVAAAVGGSVTVEDPQFRVLAYSNLEDQPLDSPRRQAILGRRAPDRWLRHLHETGVVRRLLANDDVVEVLGYRDLKPRLVIAVRAGAQLLGSVWVAEGQAPFAPGAADALREAASVAALHLLRHNATGNLRRRMQGELLVSLLEGRESSNVVASRLGIEQPAWLAVVGFELDHVEGDLDRQRHNALGLIGLQFEGIGRRAVSCTIGNVIYTLLPSRDRIPGETLLTAARHVVRRAREALHVSTRAAVGAAVPDLAHVPAARAEVDQILRALRSPGAAPAVATADDVRARIVLLSLRDIVAGRADLQAGRLRTLVEIDRRRGTSYVSTLRTYLEEFGRIDDAAKRLDIHPNTLRYRLRRLSEISGLDLNDPVERLVTELQTHLLAGDEIIDDAGDAPTDGANMTA